MTHETTGTLVMLPHSCRGPKMRLGRVFHRSVLSHGAVVLQNAVSMSHPSHSQPTGISLGHLAPVRARLRTV